MKIATSYSLDPETKLALRSAYQKLSDDLEARPDLLLLYATVTHDFAELFAELDQLAPGLSIQGGTSCLGVMTDEGFHSADGVGLGLFGISDPDGDYGVGTTTIEGDARAAGATAVQQAIDNADRPGEPPELVWLSGVPGYEEEVLLGIQDVIGTEVPIAGGSTADNTVEGFWQQFANGKIYSDAVVVSAMYPSTLTHLAFHSGYTTTEKTGLVTRAEGRTLYEIDGRPAVEVYNEWTGGVIDEYLDGGNVLSATTLYPLGRVVGTVGEMPYHRLSHPETVTSDGALTLFANIKVGEEIILMAGTRASLISRAGRVARAAQDAGRISADQIAGALVIYCAGCMLTVQDRMNEVAEEVRNALGGKPFIGTYTFGEQGCFIGGENHHGNLMISVVVFEA